MRQREKERDRERKRETERERERERAPKEACSGRGRHFVEMTLPIFQQMLQQILRRT